ncbi:MAG: hypothetical protein EOP48_17390, partial [Sphingobacteriales bacterium]
DAPDKSSYELAALLTNCLFTAVMTAFFFFTGSLFESLLNSNGLGTILKYYSITLIFLLAFSHREFFLIARTDFRGIFFMYFIRNGLFLAVVTYFFLVGHSVTLEALAVYYGLSAMIGAVLGFLIGSRNEKVGLRWNRRLTIKFLNYGRFILGTNFFALIFRNTDSFIVARLISPAAVAFYNTSTRIINFAEIPVLVFSETMLPKAAQLVKSGDLSGMKNMYEKTVAATLTFTLPFVVVVSLFTKDIVLILTGPQYLEAVPVLHIMVFFALIIPFTSQFGNIMDLTGRAKVNFRVNFGLAAVNIATNAVFVHHFGLMGSAYGTLVSYVLLFLTTQFILKRWMNISLVQIVRNVIKLYPEYYRLAFKFLNKSVRSV